MGDLGVPIFFVISGFCILSAAQATVARDQSALTFLKRRLMRIYPPFWASVAVLVCLPFFFALVTLATTHVWSVEATEGWHAYTWQDWLLLLSLGKVFCAHGKMLSTAFHGINSVYWSLAIEVQFYFVVFAALVWRRHFYKVMMVTTALGIAAMYNPTLEHSGLFLTYWPMFAVGMGLKWILDRPVPRLWWMGLPLALLLTAFVVVSYALQLHWFWGIQCYALFSVCCALTLWMAAPVDHLLRPWKTRYPLRAFIFLGAMSYSLYLLHAILIEVPTTLLMHVISLHSAGFVPLAMLLTLIPVFFFHRYCEVPFIPRRMMKPVPSTVRYDRSK